MTLPKLRPTFTFDQERLEALKAIAPEAFADGRINWEALREALGDHLEEEGRDAEHFGLFWPGKRAARRLASTPSAGALLPAPSSRARATASVRRCTCNLSKIWRLWPLTVSSARKSRSPISWFDSPSSMRRSASSSRSLSGSLNGWGRVTAGGSALRRLLERRAHCGPAGANRLPLQIPGSPGVPCELPG